MPDAAVLIAAQFWYPDAGGTLVLLYLPLIVLMMFGALPSWPHSRGWGYAPSGGLGIVLLLVVVLMLSGRL